MLIVNQKRDIVINFSKAEESIKRGKEILGIQEKIEL